MEDFGFDVNGILSVEEANKLFEEKENGTQQPEEENGTDKNNQEQSAEEVQETEQPEGVGTEEEGKQDAASEEGGGSSPNVFTSIANALKKDGILTDFDDSEIEACTTAEAFAELFEKAKRAGLEEAQKRVYDALNNGMNPDEIRQYEDTISYLDSVTDEQIRAEGDEGEELRRHIMYNDLIKRGYSDEKAKKEIEKSFKAGTDIDDAVDALDALRKTFKEQYQQKQDEAKTRADKAREDQKKQANTFKKMVLEDEVKLGETVLSKKVCERIYDAVSRPIYKDKDTGKLLTAVQKFQKEYPLEFLKQLGMWYVLTDGGKDVTGFAKEQVVAEKNRNIKELEKKINASMFNADGSLSYAGGSGGEKGDPLLSDDWKIG